MDKASRTQGILWPALPSIVRLQYLFLLPLLIVTRYLTTNSLHLSCNSHPPRRHLTIHRHPLNRPTPKT